MGNLSMTSPSSQSSLLLGQALSLPKGSEPFPWQTSLLDRLLDPNRDLPTGLDIPTGLGKTSTMAIWLVAKAFGAKLPRRLIYVVDRRVVVDQATTVAEGLRDFVRTNPEIEQKLGLSKPLPISTLRGQHVDNREWAEDPSSPAIIIGTVDMIGSRFLFEGYGVSRKMRPFHAGLLGVDALLVLDEAHLVPSFEALLETISASAETLGPTATVASAILPFRLITLSATGRQKSNVHGLAANDLEPESVTHHRLTAKKALEFCTHETEDVFTDWMADKAWKLGAQPGSPQRVLIYCNSRKAAQDVFDAIGKMAKAENLGIDRELLVGGRRVLERQEVADWLDRTGWHAGADTRPEKPAFLIATSAGEVGVDMDADHLVCDLVEWERMVQRLGRVNRRGQGDAKVLVLLEKEPTPNAREAAALAKTQSARDDKEQKLVEKFQEKSARLRRLRRPFELLPQQGDEREVSPLALRNLRGETEVRESDSSEEQAEAARKAEIVEEASTPAPLRPALTRPLMDAWSMTSLVEHTGRPKIEPWLRGWIENDEPQTQISWRMHLPVLKNGEPFPAKETSRYFDAAPLQVSEILEDKTDRVFSEIESRAKALLKMKPDEADLKPDTCIAFLLDASGEPVGNPIRLRDFKFDDGDKRARENLKRRMAHHLLVLDARFGGLAESGLLHHSSKTPVHTADDGTFWMAATGDVPVIRFRISNEPSADHGWRLNSRFPLNETEDSPATEWLFIFHWKGEGSGVHDRSIASQPQALQAHQEHAERCMKRMAETLQLPEELANALSLAARIHDEGKNCDRWQDAFSAPRDEGRPYAKTTGPISQKRLEGFRHELLSMIRARDHEKWKALSPDLQELVLHLIAAHHGFARPIIGIESCDEFPPSKLSEEAAGIALRFARLQKRWGPWGLAWLESLLRAADQQASRSLDQPKEQPQEPTHD